MGLPATRRPTREKHHEGIDPAGNHRRRRRRGILGTIALIAVAGWIWQNREALNEIAQSAASHLADIDAECGNKP